MGLDNNEIPVRCRAISAVLLKMIDGLYKVLLLKRSDSMLKDVWCYIGGGIESGEKAWETAIREIREETGITKLSLYSSNKLEHFYMVQSDYIYVAPVFVGFVDVTEEVTLNEEHTEYEWLTFFEAKKKVTLPGNEEVLDYIEKYFVDRTPVDFLRVKLGNTGI